jgi:hypothetical protein
MKINWEMVISVIVATVIISIIMGLMAKKRVTQTGEIKTSFMGFDGFNGFEGEAN